MRKFRKGLSLIIMVTFLCQNVVLGISEKDFTLRAPSHFSKSTKTFIKGQYKKERGEIKALCKEMENLTSKYEKTSSPQTKNSIIKLTKKLIDKKEAIGELNRDAIEEARQIELPLDPSVKSYIKSRAILITGAAGVGGSALCKYILDNLNPKKVILTDIDGKGLKRLKEEILSNSEERGVTLIFEVADIADRKRLDKIFESEKPEIVFHVAAERSVDRAEKNPIGAVKTNIMGTKNLAELSDHYGVERFIHTSTGKARFFYDERVYPTTKRFAEAIIFDVASRSKTRFCMVRFHQVISDDNDLLRNIRESIENENPVSIYYQEDYYMPVQSVQESVVSLLNAGVYGMEGEIHGLNRSFLDKELAAVNVALYAIKKSDKILPLFLISPPVGHKKEFFRGFTDQNDTQKKMSYLNYLESVNAEAVGNLLQARRTDFNMEDIREDLEVIYSNIDTQDEEKIKSVLIKSMGSYARNIYDHCSTEQLMQILIWGLDPQLVKEGIVHPESHREVVALLFEILTSRDLSKIDRDKLKTLKEYIDALIKMSPSDLLNTYEQARMHLDKA